MLANASPNVGRLSSEEFFIGWGESTLFLSHHVERMECLADLSKAERHGFAIVPELDEFFTTYGADHLSEVFGEAL